MLIDDSEFLRADKVPMTKKNLRRIVLSMAELDENSIVYDIGGGTGALSIDAAKRAKFVYTLEKNPASVDLIRRNVDKFNVKNLILIETNAPDQMEDLPPADVIIVGGSGGNLESILKKSVEKLKSYGRIIVTAITIQTISQTLDFFRDRDFATEAIQAQINRIERIKNLDMLFSENPIFILKAVQK